MNLEVGACCTGLPSSEDCPALEQCENTMAPLLATASCCLAGALAGRRCGLHGLEAEVARVVLSILLGPRCLG